MKKILILTPRFPYPVVGGDRLRIYEICKELSKDFELSLLSFCESKEEMEFENPKDNVFKSIEKIFLPKWRSYLNCLCALPSNVPLQIAYYKSNEFNDKLEELLVKHDLALAHLIRVGNYLLDKPTPKVLEMTDAISLNYDRVSKLAKLGGVKNFIFSIEKSRLLSYERNVAKDFDFSSLVSDIDRQFLYKSDPELMEKVLVCSNGVDVNSFAYNYEPIHNEIVFIGNMTSVQNFDAAKWFASKVMPLLQDKADYKFKVIGRISHDKKRELEGYKGVVVTGSVDCITSSAQGALLGVCPMRLGAGVQNKILEYMSLGLPTISSTLGHEGIMAESGKEILIADSPQEYVDLILKVSTDRDFAMEISKAGRKFVEAHHDWSAMLAPFVKRLKNVI
ncbi:glycosyltransferase family 4 protein [Shewanella marisflavi]|uniref:glycosyltransferase family 4 protein n=1 Tax=Shewanella marisflavi TaxID=260364 RepID=UPI003AAC4B23